MARGYARLRERNQVTVPPGIVERMGLRLGDVIEFSVNSRGVVQLHPAKIVKAGTPEASQEEQAAVRDISEGRFTLVRSLEELREHVDGIRRGETPAFSGNAETETDPVEQLLNVVPAMQVAGPITHLTEEQRQDVEQLLQAHLTNFFSNLLGQQYKIRKHEEGAAEREQI